MSLRSRCIRSSALEKTCCISIWRSAAASPLGIDHGRLAASPPVSTTSGDGGNCCTKNDEPRSHRSRLVSRVRVLSFGVSLDGYGAGPNQDLEHPLGVNGPELMEWFFHTRVFQRMYGQQAANPASTTIWRSRPSRISAPGFSAATCSARFAARGPTTAGRAGGAMNRRITRPSSC